LQAEHSETLVPVHAEHSGEHAENEKSILIYTIWLKSFHSQQCQQLRHVGTLTSIGEKILRQTYTRHANLENNNTFAAASTFEKV